MHIGDKPSSEVKQSGNNDNLPNFGQYPPEDAFIESWLYGKAKHTQTSYKRISRQLRAYLHPKTLKDADLASIQAFLLEVKGADDTKRSVAIAVKALYSFGFKSGYFPINLAGLIKSKRYQSKISERYVTEEEVMRMIVSCRGRDQTVVKVLYSGGFRIAELANLNWKDIQERDSGTGQVTFIGKGDKQRTVVLSAQTFKDLMALKSGGSKPEDAIFISREGGRISVRRLQKIVERIAKQAGIGKKVSPHWFRHAHASHSLDRGAPLHLVKETLGHSDIATTSRYLHARPNESSSKFLPV